MLGQSPGSLPVPPPADLQPAQREWGRSRSTWEPWVELDGWRELDHAWEILLQQYLGPTTEPSLELRVQWQ